MAGIRVFDENNQPEETLDCPMCRLGSPHHHSQKDFTEDFTLRSRTNHKRYLVGTYCETETPTDATDVN